MSAARSQNITDLDPRAVRIAREVIAGKNDSQIADRLGLSREHVNRLKHRPATQALLHQFLEANRAELEQAGREVVQSIREDVGQEVWAARAAARSHYLQILRLSKPEESKGEDQGPDPERQRQVRFLSRTIRRSMSDGTNIEEVWSYVETKARELVGEDISELKAEVLAAVAEGQMQEVGG